MTHDYPEHVRKLIENHPILFNTISNRYYFTFEKGWFDLVNNLCTNIERNLNSLYGDEKREYLLDPFVVGQIKEKFGGLIFYCHGYTNEVINNLINKAESDSYDICEYCGKPGEQRDSGWIKVRCDDCHKKFLIEENIRDILE